MTRLPTIDELTALNPRPVPPTPPAAADMLALVEDLDPAGIQLAPRPPRSRVIVAAALMVLAGAVVWATSLGSTTPVNVLAATYAASAPQRGAMLITYETFTHRAGRPETVLQNDWVDPVEHRTREQLRLPVPTGALTIERTREPGWIATWSSNEPGVVLRERSTLPYDTPASWSFGGLQVPDLAGTQLFRSLYHAGHLRLVGKASSGQWKLQATVTQAAHRVRVLLVAYVEPGTFVLRHQELRAVTPEGRSTVLAASTLLADRSLRPGEATGRLFELTSTHPNARLVIHPGTGPHIEPPWGARRRVTSRNR